MSVIARMLERQRISREKASQDYRASVQRAKDRRPEVLALIAEAVRGGSVRPAREHDCSDCGAIADVIWPEWFKPGGLLGNWGAIALCEDCLAKRSESE